MERKLFALVWTESKGNLEPKWRYGSPEKRTSKHVNTKHASCVHSHGRDDALCAEVFHYRMMEHKHPTALITVCHARPTHTCTYVYIYIYIYTFRSFSMMCMYLFVFCIFIFYQVTINSPPYTRLPSASLSPTDGFSSVVAGRNGTRSAPRCQDIPPPFI